MTEENLQGRACDNCACSFLVMVNEQPRGRICRLNPPFMVEVPTGITLAGESAMPARQTWTQQPVYDKNVCWQWKPRGVLPGEGFEPLHDTNSHDDPYPFLKA